jgi:hypothetical protein
MAIDEYDIKKIRTKETETEFHDPLKSQKARILRTSTHPTLNTMTFVQARPKHVTGWDVPILIPLGSLTSIVIDDATSISSNNLTATTGGISTIAAGSVTIQGGSTFTASNGAVANRVDIYTTAGVIVDDATFTINTTGTLGVWFRTITGGSSTIDLSLNRLKVTATTANGGYACMIGRDVNTSLSRAANKALGSNFQSGEIKHCDFIQNNIESGTLGCFVDTDDFVIDDSNYFRTGCCRRRYNYSSGLFMGRQHSFRL